MASSSLSVLAGGSVEEMQDSDQRVSKGSNAFNRSEIDCASMQLGAYYIVIVMLGEIPTVATAVASSDVKAVRQLTGS